MARELNDQWIEEPDGKKHMLKAVEGENCTGCAFGKMCQGSRLNNIHVCDREDDCPLEYSNTVVKDLGILNEEGCLPSAWDKALYPQVYKTTETIWYAHAESYGIFMEAKGKTKQQAIDAWNRRT
jgi:hypothetical protein